MAIETSIIVTNFNNSKYLGRCLRSLLNQSIEKDRFEIIVIDDASTDQSHIILDSFKDKVEVVYLKENKGVAFASNVGIQRALGQFVIRVDSDDYISEHTLLFMTELMLNNKDIGFVYTDHIKVDNNDEQLEKCLLEEPSDIYRHGAGVMFKKSHLEAIGLYDQDLRNAEDFDLIRRYFKNWDGYHLKLPLYRYRIHKDQITNDYGARIKAEEHVKNK